MVNAFAEKLKELLKENPEGMQTFSFNQLAACTMAYPHTDSFQMILLKDVTKRI
jgi:hypothetical protein